MKLRKLTAILMALVMIFALSATAFATEGEHTVSVVIMMDGDEVYSTDVAASNIVAVKNELQNLDVCHIYDMESHVDPNLVTYRNTYTATDALIAGWVKANMEDPYSEIETVEDALDSSIIDYTWYLNTIPNTSDQYVWGVYFTNYAGLPSDDGYYVLEDINEVGGVTYYTYHWEGYSWQLSIDDEIAELYSSEYNFNSIDEVTFDYTYMVSESFTTRAYL